MSQSQSGITLPSRKFVDTIYGMTGYWAVWEPTNDDPKIGDYGLVDSETGKFNKKGNILSDPGMQKIANGVAPSPCTRATFQYITSENAMQTELDSSYLPKSDVAEVVWQGSWRFQKGGAAMMVIDGPLIEVIPRMLDLRKYEEEKEIRDALKGMSIVTSVTKTRGYAMYLAPEGDELFSLALCVTTNPSSEAETANCRGWFEKREGGMYRASYKAEDYSTVLYKLKDFKKKEKGLLNRLKFRDDETESLKGLDMFVDTVPPWHLLNAAGEEDPWVEN